MNKFPFLTAIVASSLLWFSPPTNAQPYDISPLTITDLGGVGASGAWGGISWTQGENAADVITLGTFGNTDLPTMSLDEILSQVGLGAGSFSLEDFPLLQELSLDQLLEAVPSLSSLLPAQVPAIDALLNSYVSPTDLLNQTIGQLILGDGLGSLSLGDLPSLAGYSLNSIPGLTQTPLQSFEGWYSQVISALPGAELLPLGSLINFAPGTALFDVTFHDVESYRTNTITGSYQEGFAVPCNQPNCVHIELGAPQLGKQWISGNSQWVRGGTGCLTGTEPTGRHPFGDSFKVVLTDTKEGSGQATFSMYFRYCIECGCSPYIIGPFTYYNATEKDFIAF